jgi:L-rhamnose mutarotase
MSLERIAFKMEIHPGKSAEYRKRHDEIWPELKALLRRSGVSDYSIFIDKNTSSLFAVLKVENKVLLDALPAEALMQKWWAFMADVSVSNPDNSPVVIPLDEVFYLP